MSCARIVPGVRPTCSPGWNGRSKRTVPRRSYAVTTARSSAPKKGNAGWPSSRSRRSTSIRAAPGRTASSRASTVACATSASTRSNSGRSPKHGSSSRTSTVITTNVGPVANSVTRARRASLPCNIHSPQLPSWTLDKTTQPNDKPTSSRTHSLPGSKKRVPSLAIASFVFSTVAVVLARRQLSSHFSCLPMFGGGYLSPRARYWHNLSNWGDVICVLSVALGILVSRSL